MTPKKQRYVTRADNTRVRTPIIIPQQTREERIYGKVKNRQEYIQDADKVKYYTNLQNFYNQNVFGYGLQGRPTRFNPSTPEGQRAISATFNYAKGNAVDFLTNVSGVGLSSGISKVGNKAARAYSRVTRGVFKSSSKNGALGTLKQYSKKPIGGGAEAVVINNTPTTVGKMTSIPVEEMATRNAIPNTVRSKYIGYVKDSGVKLPTYIQKKVKVLTEETFPKYIDKLDKAMEKSGFRRVYDPNVQYRAYTNGQVVIDDIAPGNVGLDWLRRPKMIDFNISSIPEWIQQGFKLKKGGKIENNS